MSPHYNVLLEAVCCCLLVNHVVYKHVTLTSVLCYGYQHTHKISICDIASFLNYGCRTRRRILPIIAPYMYNGGHVAH